MTIVDQVIGAIVAWKEARGDGEQAMQAVINILQNRAKARGTSVYVEAVRPLQFSSMTAGGDPMLIKWPWPANAADFDAWEVAFNLAETAATGGLTDLTNGSTLYYAPDSLTASERAATPYTLPDGTQVPFPKGWNPAVVAFQVKIGSQLFFRQI